MCSFFGLKLPSPYEIGYCQRTFREGFECNFKGQTGRLSKHCQLRKTGLVAQKGWDSGFLFLISFISLQAKHLLIPAQWNWGSMAILSEWPHPSRALQNSNYLNCIIASIVHSGPQRQAIPSENRNTLPFYVRLNLGPPMRFRQMARPLMDACWQIAIFCTSGMNHMRLLCKDPISSFTSSSLSQT